MKRLFKCYPILKAISPLNTGEMGHFGLIWCSIADLGNGLYVMVRHLTQAVEFAVLMIRSFPLLQPHFQVEAEQLKIQYPNPEAIPITADKLRWYRHQKALLQRDVADRAGINRDSYVHYEDASRDYYPVDKLAKIAQVLEVDMVELMDDYNLFIYHDQGKQIRAKREALGMTINQYADALGVQPGKLRRWEKNQAQIMKSTWEKYFK